MGVLYRLIKVWTVFLHHIVTFYFYCILAMFLKKVFFLFNLNKRLCKYLEGLAWTILYVNTRVSSEVFGYLLCHVSLFMFCVPLCLTVL